VTDGKNITVRKEMLLYHSLHYLILPTERAQMAGDRLTTASSSAKSKSFPSFNLDIVHQPHHSTTIQNKKPQKK